MLKYRGGYFTGAGREAAAPCPFPNARGWGGGPRGSAGAQRRAGLAASPGRRDRGATWRTVPAPPPRDTPASSGGTTRLLPGHPPRSPGGPQASSRGTHRVLPGAPSASSRGDPPPPPGGPPASSRRLLSGGKGSAPPDRRGRTWLRGDPAQLPVSSRRWEVAPRAKLL